MKELMVPVERAVRPVQAAAARKRRMRRELLAHLTGIYEQERARGDESQALARALRRFGNPADLARELQASVPRPERWEVGLVGLFRRRPGEGGFRPALRLAALVAVFVFAALFLIPLVRVAAGDDWSDVRIGLAPQAVVTGYVFLSVFAGCGLCRALADRLGAAALLRASAYGVVILLVGVALVAGEYVAQPENALWGFMLRSPGDPHALSAWAWFTGTQLGLALVAVLLVRAERARERDDGDWTSLEIGE
jgi:ATP-dependent Clp protease ATP-binding subunit ClpC